MYNPETASRIADLRGKVGAGTITLDELREGLRLLREGRQAAMTAPKKSAAAKKAPVNVDALFDELDQMK